MQSGRVFRNGSFVGKVMVTDIGKYIFQYDTQYLNSSYPKAISVNFPLQEDAFEADFLFSFFYNLLSEGSLKEIQCEKYKIDKDDDFSRLLKTTKENTIGSITIEEEL